MNEPHRGYIELPSMHAFDYNTDLHLAHVRTYKPFRFEDDVNLLFGCSFCFAVFRPRSRSFDARTPLLAFIPDAH